MLNDSDNKIRTSGKPKHTRVLKSSCHWMSSGARHSPPVLASVLLNASSLHPENVHPLSALQFPMKKSRIILSANPARSLCCCAFCMLPSPWRAAPGVR